MVLLFAAMYFLMIAPQRKKQKEHEKMLQSLSSGDEDRDDGWDLRRDHECER